jgi:hypothetical protein
MLQIMPKGKFYIYIAITLCIIRIISWPFSFVPADETLSDRINDAIPIIGIVVLFLAKAKATKWVAVGFLMLDLMKGFLVLQQTNHFFQIFHVARIEIPEEAQAYKWSWFLLHPGLAIAWWLVIMAIVFHKEVKVILFKPAFGISNKARPAD